MDRLKQQIQQKLIANVLVDKCAHSPQLIFRDAWCRQERTLRFTTPFFRELLPKGADGSGEWETGDCVMYEANNNTGSCIVNCVLSPSSMSPEARKKKEALLKAAEHQKKQASSLIILNSWDLSRKDGDLNKLFESFDQLLEKEIPEFERRLKEKMESSSDVPVSLTEGDVHQVSLNQYERNPKARAACIAAHGTACAVCGIDFGKAYGPEFAGKIEVHHIVPLSQIGKGYVVDPVKDLIPVCPNCHMALHSKKDGVYTVEELRAMRANQ